jgi:hypothetical protein
VASAEQHQLGHLLLETSCMPHVTSGGAFVSRKTPLEDDISGSWQPEASASSSFHWRHDHACVHDLPGPHEPPGACKTKKKAHLSAGQLWLQVQRTSNLIPWDASFLPPAKRSQAVRRNAAV